MITIPLKPTSKSRWLALVAALALVPAAKAEPSFSLQQSTYSLLPGQSFSLSIMLNNPDPITIVAYDFFVHASVNNAFRITGQTFYGAVDQPNSLAPLPYAVTTSLSDVNDFGAFNQTFSAGFGTGIFLVQVITFELDAGASQGYLGLSLGWNQPSPIGGPSALDSTGIEHQAATPVTATIAVVPEPHETGRALAAAALLLVMARWLQRRRAVKV
jgi:hypothetical protein